MEDAHSGFQVADGGGHDQGWEDADRFGDLFDLHPHQMLA